MKILIYFIFNDLFIFLVKLTILKKINIILFNYIFYDK